MSPLLEKRPASGGGPKPKFAVVRFPGSNCDQDAYFVIRDVLECPVEYVWHQETVLDGFDVVILPGGFSYGDYLRTGAIARFAPIMDAVRAHAERGGFVGIYFMPFLHPAGQARAEDVVRHLEHAVQVCGEDHVGIGTDGSVTPIDDLERYRERLVQEVAARRAAGISSPGEGPATLPFVINLRGVDQFRQLARLLAARGHSDTRIEKILGGNFLRYARDVWGA